MQEKIFEGIFALCAILSIFAVLMICFFLFVNAIPTISQIGFFDFIFGMDWYPTEGIFGIFPMIVGSFYVTALAILIGVPLGVFKRNLPLTFCQQARKKVYSSSY